MLQPEHVSRSTFCYSLPFASVKRWHPDKNPDQKETAQRHLAHTGFVDLFASVNTSVSDYGCEVCKYDCEQPGDLRWTAYVRSTKP